MRKLKFDNSEVLQIVTTIILIVAPLVIGTVIFFSCARCKNCDSICYTKYCTNCGSARSNSCINCDRYISDYYEYCPNCGKFIEN